MSEPASNGNDPQSEAPIETPAQAEETKQQHNEVAQEPQQGEPNEHDLRCPRCSSLLVCSGDARRLVGRREFGHSIVVAADQDSPGARLDVYEELWMLRDQWGFANIGVSREVPPLAEADRLRHGISAELVQARANERFRYLTCSDCDLGPLGLTYGLDNEWFLWPARVIHEERAGDEAGAGNGNAGIDVGLLQSLFQAQLGGAEAGPAQAGDEDKANDE